MLLTTIACMSASVVLYDVRRTLSHVGTVTKRDCGSIHSLPQLRPTLPRIALRYVRTPW